MCSRISRALVLAALFAWSSGHLHAQVSVTTYHNDVSRSGQNSQETILTPSNVNSVQFGKLFSVFVDGAVYAQPLYLANLSIAGGTHNVVYVVTEHDSVYAIDADVGTVYAQVSLIPAGGTTVSSSADLKCTDLVPEVGITGTPVIDPVSGTLYVVAKSKVNGAFVQYLYALSVSTLAEKESGPVLVQAVVAGTGYDASGGKITFNALMENQRAALLLDQGHVVVAWSSHCDTNPFHGWVISYNAATLAQEAVFNSSPNGYRNGIWMSGGGLAADANGNIYFPTGNGSFNGTSDYGDSIVKLAPPANGTFAVADYFTPYNQGSLSTNDEDVAAGGLVLLATLPSGAQLLAQQGKLGTIYLLNRGNLGKYCIVQTPACTNSDPQVVQEIFGASSGVWGSPAYWNGNLYWTGANDAIQAYSFNANGSGKLSSTPTSQSAQIFAFSAPTPSISANGTGNGILWALDGSADDSMCDTGTSCMGLYAYDATNLANLLYKSSQAANNRDSPGTALKFETPTIANGKVYVGTRGALSVYGLLTNALPAAAAPTFSPAPGTYTTPQTVTLASSTPGAVIYYTTDGTQPSVSSAVYSTPITVSASQTVQAFTAAPAYASSAVVSGGFLLGASSNVNLSPVDTVYAATARGSAPLSGGYDNDGYAYAANLLGTTLTWGGSTFVLGIGGVADAASNATIPLPAGSYGSLTLLGSAVNGNQANQTFTVNYTDGTSTKISQSLSDWRLPHNNAGETQVLKMSYAVAPSGATVYGLFYVYGYTFSIDNTKTVQSLTLPANRNVVILAVDVAQPALQYSSGFTSGVGLTFLGSATLGSGALHLTTGANYQAGAVWSGTPLNVQNFTTDFTFKVTPGSASIADGFTFTLQNAGLGALGAYGGALGYQGIGSSVAIKFDLYSNAGEGTDSTGFYIDGAAPTLPSIDMKSSGVNLHSGDAMHAHVTYDGTTLTLTLTDTVSGASFTTSQAINIPAAVGGSTAYAGFTAGTGGMNCSQAIQSWTFVSGGTASTTTGPPPVVNDPSGFASSAGLNLIGVKLNNSHLELTDGGTAEGNAVWTATPVNVQKFTTDFSFQLSSVGTTMADGFTFAIQNAGAAAVGATGGALGYAGVGSSVAVKFDLYSNAGEGIDSTGFYSDGASPTTPALNMSASGVNLHSGDVLHAHLVYDGSTLALTVTDTQTNASFTASQAIDIAGTVGAATAYVGFTAGAGGLSSLQQILNWTFAVN